MTHSVLVLLLSDGKYQRASVSRFSDELLLTRGRVCEDINPRARPSASMKPDSMVSDPLKISVLS